METLYFLIPIALLFCVITLKLVLWAIQSGQYDDLDRQSHLIFEEDTPTQDYQEGDTDDNN